MQIVGVFMASLFGLVSIIRSIKQFPVSSFQTLSFALGMTAIFAKYFF
jgi:hypothetical protein